MNNSTAHMTAKPRLHHFDMIKGVAIFLVVMGHIITMCVREIDRTPLFKFIEQIHMPLFFFISGWFIFKADSDGTIKLPKITPRILQLLVPMIAVSSLWVWYFPHSGLESPIQSTFDALWHNEYKNGYWFTLVLFMMSLLYAVSVPLLNRLKSVAASIAFVTTVWLIIFCIWHYILSDTASGILSFMHIVNFYPIFMTGVLARRYQNSFMRWVNNTWVSTAAILVACVTMYICCWPWEFGFNVFTGLVIKIILHISLTLIILPIFKSWENYAYAAEAPTSRRIFPKIWELLGRESLAIYLLHYFLLFPMGQAFRPYLESVNVSLIPVAVFSAFWATVIIAAVLCIVKLLEPSKPLSIILIGKK